MAHLGLLVSSKLLKIFTCSFKKSLAGLGLKKNSKFQLKTHAKLSRSRKQTPSSQGCMWAVWCPRAQGCRAWKREDRAESSNSWPTQKGSTGNKFWPFLLIQDVKAIWWRDRVAGLEMNKRCMFPHTKSFTVREPKVQMCSKGMRHVPRGQARGNFWIQPPPWKIPQPLHCQDLPQVTLCFIFLPKHLLMAAIRDNIRS